MAQPSMSRILAHGLRVELDDAHFAATPNAFHQFSAQDKG